MIRSEMEVFSPNHTKRWIELIGLDVNGIYEISVAGKTRYGVGKASMKIQAGKKEFYLALSILIIRMIKSNEIKHWSGSGKVVFCKKDTGQNNN